MAIMKFVSPLSVKVSSRKKFILNLNNYRGNHYRVLNNAKKVYKEEMKDQILSCKEKFGKVIIVYTVYQPTKRRFDIGNVCSVHQKFFEDALVEFGRLDDDRYNYVPMCCYCFGGINPDDARVDIHVIDMDNEGFTYLNKLLAKNIQKLYSGNTK